MNYPLQTPEQLNLLLKSFRKKRGFTQAAIAAKLGVSQQTYQQLEAKPHHATLERLFKVLRILEVRIELQDEQEKQCRAADHLDDEGFDGEKW